MNIEEIISKPVNKWKYKECQEILNSQEATQELKDEASTRMNDIKKWLKSKEEGEKKGKEAGQEATKPNKLHLSSIDIPLETLVEIESSVNGWVNTNAAQYYYFEEYFNTRGITNPAFIGMFYKEFKEDMRVIAERKYQEEKNE